jgi:hypothetical protein
MFDDYRRLKMSYAGKIEDLIAERDQLRSDLERERMRLAACGCVAMADTPESAAYTRNMHPDYRSASCDDVARRVDECMALRKDAARYRWLRDGCDEKKSAASRIAADCYGLEWDAKIDAAMAGQG